MIETTTPGASVVRDRSIGRDALHLLSRAVPGALFLWAGIGKALDRQGTILSVDAYDVLPDAVVTPVAVALPWIEIVLGVFLVLGLFLRFSGLGTAALVAVFLVGMAHAKARGLAIDCGCFGASGGRGDGVSWWDMVRDIPLLLMGLYLAWRPTGPFRIDAFLEVDEDEHQGS